MAAEALDLAQQSRAIAAEEVDKAIRELVRAERVREEAIVQNLIDKRASGGAGRTQESGEPDTRLATNKSL